MDQVNDVVLCAIGRPLTVSVIDAPGGGPAWNVMVRLGAECASGVVPLMPVSMTPEHARWLARELNNAAGIIEARAGGN